jgi:SM-20-related protein
MLNLDALEPVVIERVPFPHVVIPQFISKSDCADIRDNYLEMEIPDGNQYNKFRLGQSFIKLIGELHGSEFESLVERKFDVELKGLKKATVVRNESYNSDGDAHTDMPNKIITALIYFNERWQGSEGCLRLLRSNNLDDHFMEVPPLDGTLVLFHRTNNSWHGYKRLAGPRRMIQLNWHR